MAYWIVNCKYFLNVLTLKNPITNEFLDPYFPFLLSYDTDISKKKFIKKCEDMLVK